MIRGVQRVLIVVMGNVVHCEYVQALFQKYECASENSVNANSEVRFEYEIKFRIMLGLKPRGAETKRLTTICRSYGWDGSTMFIFFG